MPFSTDVATLEPRLAISCYGHLPDSFNNFSFRFYSTRNSLSLQARTPHHSLLLDSPSQLELIMGPSSPYLLLIAFVFKICAFPHLAQRFDLSSVAPVSRRSADSSIYTWSPSQLVDVTGSHAYADPLPGQARGSDRSMPSP
jgi:hypothetical protein